MSTNARDIKQALHALADQLPENATWEAPVPPLNYTRNILDRQ